MKSEKHYQVSEQFVLEAYESACSTWKQKLEATFPDIFSSYLIKKVHTFYIHQSKGETYIFAYDEEGSSRVYGFWRGIWHDMGNQTWSWLSLNKNSLKCRLATQEEIEKAFIQEAIKRGFVDGCSFIPVKGYEVWTKSGNISFKYDLHTGLSIFSDKCETKTDGYSMTGRFDHLCIYKNGVWAEIVEEKEICLTMDEIADKFGINVDKLKIKK